MLLKFSLEKIQADTLTTIYFTEWKGPTAEAIMPDIQSQLCDKSAKLKNLNITDMTDTTDQGRQ